MPNILLLGADPATVSMYRTHFERAGVALASAEIVEPVSDFIRLAQPAAVLLDVTQAKSDGNELLRGIREETEFRNLPLFALTDVPLGKGSHATRAFQKVPASVPEVVKAVTAALNHIPEAAPATAVVNGQPNPAAAEENAQPAEPTKTVPSDETSKGVHQLEATFQLFANAADAQRSALLTQMQDQVRNLRRGFLAAKANVLAAFTSALARLLITLAKDPARVNASSLRTLSLAIDVLVQAVDSGTMQAEIESGPVRVLVMDDEALSRRAVQFALGCPDLELADCDSPERALECLKNGTFDVIFTEARLANSVSFTTRLRQLPKRPDVPVILITALAEFEASTASVAKADCDLIAKPFTPSEMVAKAFTFAVKRRLGKCVCSFVASASASAGAVSAPIPFSLNEKSLTAVANGNGNGNGNHPAVENALEHPAPPQIEFTGARRNVLPGLGSSQPRIESAPRVQELEGRLKKIEEELVSKDGRLKSLEAELADAEGKVKTLEGDLAAKDGKLRTLETELASKANTSKHLEQDLATREGRLKLVETDLSEKEGKVKALEDEVGVKEGMVKSLEAELASKQSAFKNLEDELAAKSSKFKSLEAELAHRHGKLRILEESLASKDERVQSLETELASKQDAFKNLEKELAGKCDQLKSLEQELATQTSRAASEDAEKTEAISKAAELEKRCEAAEKNLQEQTRRVAELQAAKEAADLAATSAAGLKNLEPQLQKEIEARLASEKRTAQLEQQLQDLECRMAEQGADCERLRQENHKMRTIEETLKIQVEERDGALSELKDSVARTTAQVEKEAALRGAAEEQLKSLTEKQRLLEQESAERAQLDEQSRAALSAEAATLKTQLETTAAEKAELQAKLNGLHAENCRQSISAGGSLQERIDDMTAYDLVTGELTRVRSQLAEERTHRQRLQNQLAELEDTKQDLTNKLEAFSAAERARQETTQGLEAKLQETISKLSNVESSLQTQTRESRKLQQRAKELEEQVSDLSNQLTTQAVIDQSRRRREAELEACIVEQQAQIANSKSALAAESATMQRTRERIQFALCRVIQELNADKDSLAASTAMAQATASPAEEPVHVE